jgi:hypothetical protein
MALPRPSYVYIMASEWLLSANGSRCMDMTVGGRASGLSLLSLLDTGDVARNARAHEITKYHFNSRFILVFSASLSSGSLLDAGIPGGGMSISGSSIIQIADTCSLDSTSAPHPERGTTNTHSPEVFKSSSLLVLTFCVLVMGSQFSRSC